MNTRIIIPIGLIALMFFSSCRMTRYVTTTEQDDVYYSYADRTEAETYAVTATAQEETRLDANPNERYDEDDFYYSRRVRRFNGNSRQNWRYYDPYNSNDMYYVMGTPYWSRWNNMGWHQWGNPRFFSPCQQNSMAFSWGGGNFYNPYSYNPWMSHNYYNPWVNNYYGFSPAYGYGNSWGWGGSNGYCTGFNQGYANGYNSGVNAGGFNTGTNYAGNVHVGPRGNTQSLTGAGTSRPTVKNPGRTNAAVASNSPTPRSNTYMAPKPRTNTAPVYKPSQSRPTKGRTYQSTRPSRSNSYSKPRSTRSNRSNSNKSYSKPRSNSNKSYSKPRSSSNSRSSYSAPSRSSSGSSGRSSRSSGRTPR